MKPLGILIIEANSNLRSLLGWHLQQAGYHPIQAADLNTARELTEKDKPDLILLDTDLPENSDGLNFCRWLGQQSRALVLILSAKITEADVVAGLRAGADDYLKKPFGMQELLARVEALLRRDRLTRAPLLLEYGDLKIDLVHRRACIKDQYIELTPQEFSLLYVLAQANGNALSRAELLRRAWPNTIDNPRTIDTHILSLRKKIELDPRQPNLIQTVRNVGYRCNLAILNSDRLVGTLPRYIAQVS